MADIHIHLQLNFTPWHSTIHHISFHLNTNVVKQLQNFLTQINLEKKEQQSEINTNFLYTLLSIQTMADRADGSFMYRKNIKTFLSHLFIFILFLFLHSFTATFCASDWLNSFSPFKHSTYNNNNKKNTQQRYNIYFILFFYLFLSEPNAKATTTRKKNLRII